MEIFPELMIKQVGFRVIFVGVFLVFFFFFLAKALISNSVDKIFKAEFSKILCKMRVQSSP